MLDKSHRMSFRTHDHSVFSVPALRKPNDGNSDPNLGVFVRENGGMVVAAFRMFQNPVRLTASLFLKAGKAMDKCNNFSLGIPRIRAHAFANAAWSSS